MVKLLWEGLVLFGYGVLLFAIAVVYVVLGLVAKGIRWTQRPGPKPIDARLLIPRPAPEKISAVPLHCRWCGRTTFHLRRRSSFVCQFLAEHHATENYRKLAAVLPDAEQYPGCICHPGEVTLFEGKPDPFCFGLEHRP